MKLRSLLSVASLGLTALATAPVAMAQNADHPGKAIYEQRCAACHDNPGATPGTERATQLDVIRATPSEQLRASLTGDGIMAPMAAGIADAQLDQLIGWLTANQKATAAAWDAAMMCAADNRTIDFSSTSSVPYMGGDKKSTRRLSAQQAGISKADIPNLKVSYALGYPRAQSLGVGVVTAGDTAFVNSGGKLMAIDANEGCARWIFDGGGSRTTPTLTEINGTPALVYVLGRSEIQAVNATNGEPIWKVDGTPESAGGSIRGGVIIHDNKVLIPISASGVGSGMNPRFECCTGHGAVVALNLADGSRLWDYHTMPEATYNGQVSPTGVKQKGPSGAPIWSMPTIDAKRNAVIVTTGENTSYPATVTSDAIISIDLDTGKENWVFQAMENDVWNMACRTDDTDSGPNCPWQYDEENVGRDFDFGGAAILTRTKGGWFGIGAKDILLAGQKSGHIWAIDANDGSVIWSDQVGEGTPLGGNHWGIAIDDERVFLTIADSIPVSANMKPGVYAYRIKDGKQLWHFSAEAECDAARKEHVNNCETKYGFSSTPLVVDGVLVAGTLDGKVYFFDGKSGDILKSFDFAGPIETSNGVEAKGGSLDAHAISAGAGKIFLSSGYGGFSQTPGNALIVLEPAN